MLEYRSHSHGHTTKGIAPGEYEWTAQNYVKLDDLFEWEQEQCPDLCQGIVSL